MNFYFENLYKSYDGKKIFENINGRIDSEDRIGLIGTNGIGKTTLAKIISGRETSEKGKVEISSSLKILYIDQEPKFDANISAYDELFKFSLSNDSNTRKPEFIIQKALNTIGLAKELWYQKAKYLSGGEKTKLMLCKIMISNFDLLILDEPTNHLDLVSCQWLEEYLIQLNKTILVISHDRFFLDKVTNKIWELTSESLKVYKGNYSEYKIQKENEIKSIMKEYEKQQSKIQSLEKVISERKNWFTSAHSSAGQNDFYRAKSKKHASVIKAKERELEKLETNKIDKPKKIVSPAFEVINKNILEAKLPPILVRVENLYKKYGKRTIFEKISFNVMREDKIALIGDNGVGKTTLLKIIKDLDGEYEGKVVINPSVRIGYFSQELGNLNSKNNIIDEILLIGSRPDEARMLLAVLFFKEDDIQKTINDLSMGEKCRVAFAKLILSGANLLILDEPTNYMDIISKEKIEEALEDFQGSIIFVSHDRYFIKKIANRIIEIENKKIKFYDGDYCYYLSKKQEEFVQDKIGRDYNQISNNIRRLECELSFISGKLAEPLEEEKKEQLNEKFMKIAKELNANKAIIEKVK
ncbi:ribosomal protection-like ABC-F family protein [Maledivibacter halophilus]|uniref:ABC transporter n=1 Tax=Maledivibacter halophilus TaxID=36842 RepID=A0A1T5LNG9_9FIRM|nr:ABC-F type ribosomal protection protein [Maledivibacter halophilus]SKC77464.1 ABC transporter [Maledivibacter halophilus]